MVDLSARYKMPMYKSGTWETEQDEVEVTCVRDRNNIRVVCDGYDSKGFYEEYFEWLLYTGYIKKIEEKKLN